MRAAFPLLFLVDFLHGPSNVALIGGALLCSLPETDRAHGREGEENTKSNAQSPDGLHFQAGGLGGVDPLGIIHLSIFVQTVAQC